MTAFKGWVASSLVTAFIGAVVALLDVGNGYDWHSLNYPLPIVRANHDRIYLADFAYLGFLSVSVYWFVWNRVGKLFPDFRNASGLLLVLAMLLFLFAAGDFIGHYIPQTYHCNVRTFPNGLTIRTCPHAPNPRMWIAFAAGISLIASLFFAVRNSNVDQTEIEGEV